VDRFNVVRHARDAGYFLAVEPRGNGVHQTADHERLLRVGFHDLGIDHLAGDVEKRGHVHAVGHFQQADTFLRPRIEAAHPVRAVRNERFGQIAEAQFLRLDLPLAQRLAKMGRGLLGTIQIVTAFQFSIFDSHVKLSIV